MLLGLLGLPAWLATKTGNASPLLTPASTQRSRRATEESVAPKIDGIFAPLIDAVSPGAAVLVRKSGETFFERGYGVCDLRSLNKIDATTNFRLASCTKQFTAMAIMLLVHDRKLRYDDKLTDVFPDFPAYGNTITIRNLLNHTSGLHDYEDLMDRLHPSRWSEQRQIRDAEVLDLLKQQSGTRFPPGTLWAYSNSGYVLLDLVVAKVSGKSFAQFLNERIFTPLGMIHTVAYEKGKSEIANRAFGHTRGAQGWQQTDQSATSATLGDGGVYSSLEDLAKWDEALTKHTLLSEEEMQPALTAVKLPGGGQTVWPANSDLPAGTPASYGFGWFLDPYKGHARTWHFGETMGFRTYIERFANGQLTIIVLCNRAGLSTGTLASQIADLALPVR
jgi:CubicO group peptidase (beta-lactamase class C family)